MSPLSFAAGRGLAVAVLLVVAVAACGRRGPLEPPVDAAYIQSQQDKQEARKRQEARAAARSTRKVVQGDPTDDNDDDEGDEDVVITPAPGPRELPGQTNRRRTRAFTVPKEPFILDPLL